MNLLWFYTACLQAEFDPPYAYSNYLLNENIDEKAHQATTTGLWDSAYIFLFSQKVCNYV